MEKEIPPSRMAQNRIVQLGEYHGNNVIKIND